MTANIPEAMDERAAFEAFWLETRGARKARRELPRHPLQHETYIADSANRHWVTWQAARANPAGGEPIGWLYPHGTFFVKGATRPDERASWQPLYARANLPLPQGDADKVDAERWRYAIKDDGTGRMNWRAVYDAWDGDGYFVDALDAARLTPGGQP